MPTRIIALVDLEETSSILVDSVFKVSKALNAEVVFVHKLVESKPAMAYQDVRSELSRMEKKEAWEKLNAFVKPYPFKNVLYKIGRFDFPSALNQLKDEQHTDFVVVGIKESGLLEKIFLSSTILSIIDETDFNAVGIPLAGKNGVPRKLVLLCTPNSPFRKKQLEVVIRLFDGIVLNISLVSEKTDEDSKLYLKEIESAIISYSLKAEVCVIPEGFSEVVGKLAKETDTYFVIQQESKVLKTNIFQKTLIGDMVYSGCSPLLVIPQ